MFKKNVKEIKGNVIEVSTDTAVTKAAKKTVKKETKKTAKLNVEEVTFTEFKEKLRETSLKDLKEYVKAVKGNLWEGIKDEGILRMRLTMELKAAYYPDKVKKVVPRTPVESPWKRIDTKTLIKAVKAKKREYKPTTNEPILRMRLIMILKAEGVAPETL